MAGGPQGTPFGQYLLGKSLAKGGMGEVFIGIRPGLGGFEKPLAIKMLLPHLASEPQVVEMFLTEARLAARMNHPNIVQIFDVGKAHDCYFIVMELVRGVSLSKLLAALRHRGRQASAGVILHIAHALCRGLQHAHDQTDDRGTPLEIVHRDVSPQNVLVSIDGEVKLTDFGIAKVKSSITLTQPGTFKGKLEYVSPEQATGGQVDRRTDVFSAGIVLYELSTLESPFHRDNTADTAQAVIRAPLPDLATARPDLPSQIGKALARATKKDPAGRFANAIELAAALPDAPAQAGPELAALIRDLCRDSIASLARDAEVTAQLKSLPAPGRKITALTSPAGGQDRKETVATARFFPTPVKSESPTAVRIDFPTPLAGDSHNPAPRVGRRWLIAGLGLFAVAAGVIGVGSLSSPKTVASHPVAAPPVAPSPVAPPPVAASSGPAPQALPPTRRATRPSTPKVGYLSVDAIPWGAVYLDGRKIGETPIYGYPIPAGSATVELRNSETRKNAVRHLRIGPSEKISIKADLQ